ASTPMSVSTIRLLLLFYVELALLELHATWVVVGIELIAIVSRQAGVLRVVADIHETAVRHVFAARREVLFERAGIARLAAAAERPVLIETQVAPIVVDPAGGAAGGRFVAAL